MAINDYVRTAIQRLGAWFLEGKLCCPRSLPSLTSAIVANIPDAETQYHAHEFLDVTVQPKPIYISPNEVYAMHGLLSQHLDDLVCGIFVCLMNLLLMLAQAPERSDTLRSIIQELGGVPNLGSDELRDARDTVITLELTNRFAHVRGMCCLCQKAAFNLIARTYRP